MSEAKFADDSLSNFWWFKQIQGKSTTRRNKLNRKQIFCWMLRTLTKGWYLRCYKYRHRNVDVYPNTYFLVKAAFFIEGIQWTSSINKKPQTNKARQIFWRNWRKICQLLQVAYWLATKLKKLCVNSCIVTTPLPPCSHMCVFSWKVQT